MPATGISDRNEIQEKPLSPLRAIRRHCLACAGRPSEVRACASYECKLHCFRMGHNPARRGVGPGRIIKASSGAKRDDSMAVFSGIGVGEGSGMVKVASFDYEAMKREGISPLSIESSGKIQISRTDKGMVIELTTES